MQLPLETMTTAQKLDAMEQLWASLRSSADYSPPDWHAEILAERKRRVENGETTFSSLDDVVSRIKQGRK
ncbi:addiction module protein [Rosistilla oblonga]|uniref:addiction module protein n=1 Tax=Rosistilla oblonga TaxID=2527990 RepID=UPI003A96A68C